MSFLEGFDKTAGSKDSDDGITPKKAFLGGTAAGAAIHAGHDYILDKKERKTSNSKSFAALKKKLQPGDILISGETPKTSYKPRLGALLPKNIRKHIPRPITGLRPWTLSTSLSAISGAKKYHAGVYLGKGRVGHMMNEALNQSIEDAMSKQNVTAYRFKNSTKKERDSAVKYVRETVKKKPPFSLAKQWPQFATNMLSPAGRKACRTRKGSQVCNTLVARAYHKRPFTMQGEHTYSGDLRKAKDLIPVARKESYKEPLGFLLRKHIGHVSKGVKFGLGAAGATAAYKYLRRKKTDE